VWLDPELALDHNGLCLKDMFSSNSWCVHSLKKERITGTYQLLVTGYLNISGVIKKNLLLQSQ